MNRLIVKLAWPVCLGLISQTAVQVTDTAMVGVLGKQSLAAAGLGGILYWTVMSLPMGFSIGVQAIIARRYGEKDFAAAGRVMRTCILTVIPLSLFFTFCGALYSERIMLLLSDNPDIQKMTAAFFAIRMYGFIFYFQINVLTGFFVGLGRTTISMAAAMTAAVSNVFFNWILIYGNLGVPALGLNGAAWASGLAGIMGLLVLLFFSLRADMRVFFRHAGNWFDFASMREILHISFPPVMQQLLTNVAFLFFFRIADKIGIVALATTNVIVAIIHLSFMPGLSFGIAAATILGQSMGAGKFHLARLAVSRAAIHAALLMGCVGLLFFMLPREFLRLFTNDPDVIADALLPLAIIALAQPSDAYHMVFSSALNSAGRLYWVMGAYFVASYGVMLPLAYGLGVLAGLGSVGLWTTVAIWLTGLGALFFWKFKQGDWKHARV